MNGRARGLLALVFLLSLGLLVAIHLAVAAEDESLRMDAEREAAFERERAAEQELRDAVRALLDSRRGRMSERLRESLRKESGRLAPEVLVDLRRTLDAEEHAGRAADHSNAAVFPLPKAPQAGTSKELPLPKGWRAWLLVPWALLTAALLALWWQRCWHAPLAELEAAIGRGAGGTALPSLARALDPVIRELASARLALQQHVDAKTGQLARALEVQQQQKDALALLIRDLEAAREQLVRQEKLAAIGTLAAGVAHEFNNILGGVRGCAREALACKPAADVEECLLMIVRASDRGRGIVEGLGQLGRRRQEHALPVAPETLVAEVLRLQRQAAEEKEIRLVDETRGSPDVLADATALQQMCMNLVKNAIEASPAGGVVRISTESARGLLRVCVDDDGTGVPESARARLFEPFFTTREKSGGTGLGLAVTHGLALAQGGSTGYAPREPRGSRFWFEVPLAKREA